MKPDESQKFFIEAKVQELGSLESVENFYRTKNGKLDSVCSYARQYATKIFKKGKGKEN